MPNEDGEACGSQKNSPTIEAVSIKLPPFWHEKPEIWFVQAEAQFQLSNISKEATRFNYLMAQLDLKTVENIWDLVDSNHPDKYSRAKQRLLGIYKESSEKQIKKLIGEVQLGDLKPSQLLRKMRSLAGSDVSDKLLQTLWLDKLPDNIKTILAISEGDLNKLADIGDKIWEMNPNKELYVVSQPTNNPSCFEELLAKISSLEQRIEAMHMTRRRSPSSRSSSCSSRSSRNSYNRRKYNPGGKYCYFHYRFGKRCKPEKCVQPCSWSTRTGRPEN